MYPLDFEEFCWACDVGEDALSHVTQCFANGAPVLGAIHDRLLSLFHHYLMVGGMPAAVTEYVATKNLSEVRSIQDDILRLYRWDIAQYAPEEHKLVIREIFDQVPSQLDSQSKRFTFSSIAPRGTYERYENQVLWLVDAGVVLPTISVSEPRHPLRLVEGRSYFKLFMDDVGLLTCASGLQVMKSIVSDELGVNFGAIYENAVAQELHAHGRDLHYYRNRKDGEVDFVYERGGGSVLPVEVKSGKYYKRHSALTHLLSRNNYTIDTAMVLCEDNVSRSGSVLHCPIYMAMCL